MFGSSLRSRPGQAAPLGAIARRGGANFAIEAPHAERVDLCLFKAGAAQEYVRLPMQADGRGRFHLWVQGARAGQQYGYRVHGPFAPEAGHYFNPAKLLLDPWARAVTGPLHFDALQCTFETDGVPSPSDSAPAMQRSVVCAANRPVRDSERPVIPMADTVIYECHVKGMTARHPRVPEPLRGTFLGLCQPAVIEHLKSIGVTTISLLPVAAAYDEAHLVAKGLSNYWGYAPVCPFAPAPRFATRGGDPVKEFRQMVAELHRVGLEVILDVVFNHTAEGGADGLTVSYRGVDNSGFYALGAEPPHPYVDHTGCGNSLDLSRPACLRHVLDALRYWVVEMGVDGFRFDLATTLARRQDGFANDAPFLSAIVQDPHLRESKLIAEPWDVGMGGYQLGAFPPPFAEWNDRFRDGVRSFFRSDEGQAPALATRLAGSSDVFGAPLRGPTASINFVTSHDGFTLADLVRYRERHNEENGEDNRDGHHGNFSQNFGHEGPTTLPEVEQARATAQRAMTLCLAVAHGVPMLAHGDELGRTQRGNNNAYCQDNPLTYVDWHAPGASQLLPFFQTVFALRKRHPCLRVIEHMHGQEREGRADMSWWRVDGSVLESGEDWASARSFAMRVCGELGDGVLLVVNGGQERVRFALPPADPDHGWVLVADAAYAEPPLDGRALRGFTVGGQSAAVFEQRRAM